MPTIFVFSARNVLARAGRSLLALCLAVTAVSASANQGDIDPHMVNAADVSAAKNLMLQNPKEAFWALRDLKDRLVRYGVTDSITTVQNVHWLYAQASADIDCGTAYKALYQSAALGFVAQAPHRVEVYQKREQKLLQCLPDGIRESVEQAAWRELRTSKLRDLVTLQNVAAAQRGEAHAGAPVAQATVTAPEQPTEAASTASEASEEASPAVVRIGDKIKPLFEALFTLAMAIGVMSVLFSIYKAAGGGIVESGQAATPATPQASTTTKTSAKRTTPGRSSTTSTQRPTGATKRRRVGLVRVRPWD
jgi:ABC-type cobalt transport system substrate-binding protein